MPAAAALPRPVVRPARWRVARTLALAVLLAAAACQRAPLPPADLVARLGERAVHYPEFERYVVANLGESGATLQSEVLSSLFDQFLSEQLLLQLAVERRLVPVGAEPRRAVEALLARPPAPSPTDAEVEAYYGAHRERFTRPERVHLRQILVADRAAAERAQRELKGGADFADVARRLSRDPSAGRGGDQGELGRDDLPAALAEVIFRLPAGGVSDIVPADYGFHIFQVSERFPPQEVTLADAAEEIRVLLRRQRVDERMQALVNEARGRYNVTVYARNLPFQYRGVYAAAPA